MEHSTVIEIYLHRCFETCPSQSLKRCKHPLSLKTHRLSSLLLSNDIDTATISLCAGGVPENVWTTKRKIAFKFMVWAVEKQAGCPHKLWDESLWRRSKLQWLILERLFMELLIWEEKTIHKNADDIWATVCQKAQPEVLWAQRTDPAEGKVFFKQDKEHSNHNAYVSGVPSRQQTEVQHQCELLNLLRVTWAGLWPTLRSAQVNVTTVAFINYVNRSQSRVWNTGTCGTPDWAHIHTKSYSIDALARPVQRCCCFPVQGKLSAGWSAASREPCVNAAGGWISRRLPAGGCLLNSKCYGCSLLGCNYYPRMLHVV